MVRFKKIEMKTKAASRPRDSIDPNKTNFIKKQYTTNITRIDLTASKNAQSSGMRILPKVLENQNQLFELESDKNDSNSLEDYNESIGSEKLANSIQKDGRLKIK